MRISLLLEEYCPCYISYASSSLLSLNLHVVIAVTACYRGMTITSGVITITKDQGNLIGISIGGGAPHCPCLYIVQVPFRSLVCRHSSLASTLFVLDGFNTSKTYSKRNILGGEPGITTVTSTNALWLSI